MRRSIALSSRPSLGRERQLAERAGAMRHAATPSEARLFEALRGRRLGVGFKRQVPVLGRYIVDLLAAEVRLVVEVDGATTRNASAPMRAGIGRSSARGTTCCGSKRGSSRAISRRPCAA